MENIKALLHTVASDMLAWVKAGAPESNEFDFETQFGLCTNLAYHPAVHSSFPFDDELEDCFQSWPHFTGSSGYPVPSPNHYDSAGYAYAHNIAFPKYSGEYGALRIDLLKHIIQCTA